MFKVPELLINSSSNGPFLSFSPINSPKRKVLNRPKPKELLIPSFGNSGDTIDSMENFEEDNIPMSFYQDPSITSKKGKPSENIVFMEPEEFEKKIKTSIPKLRHELNDRAFKKQHSDIDKEKGPVVKKLKKEPIYEDLVNRNNFLRVLHGLKEINPTIKAKTEALRKQTQTVNDEIDYRKRRQGKGTKKNKLRLKTIARLTKKLINLRNKARKKLNFKKIKKLSSNKLIKKNKNNRTIKLVCKCKKISR